MENMGRFASGIEEISQKLDVLLTGDQLELWQKNFDQLREAGVPETLAKTIAGTPFLYSALGIIEAQQKSGFSLEYVAEAFFRMGETLDLHWFAQQLNQAQPSTHWQALARESFREDLDWQQRSITAGMLNGVKAGESIADRIGSWKTQHGELIERWHVMLTELKATKDPEFPMYSVALRELLDIAQATTHVNP